jgi:pimeloyl-ACP methyl ester carboxylesterase
LLSGGVRGAADISSDADAIAQALEREAITNATVVAWCNGGRVALELAARFPERVSSLVLLAPTCLGAGDAELPGSSFEESLNIVAKAAINQPKLAELLASTLQPTAALDWDRVANSPAARAKMLFRLPATEYARELFAPFATGESLLHYARRCLSDLAHDQERTLGLIRQPVMLITGEADDIVNNSLTLATLRRTLNEFVHVSLSGAGHYIHDLQYPYLLWALHHWHADKDLLRSTARARVERISR